MIEGRKKCFLLVGYFGNVMGVIFVIIMVDEFFDGLIGDIVNLIYLGIVVVMGDWF